jgi:4-hydroxy-2-oxoheptanedioate aldolase
MKPPRNRIHECLRSGAVAYGVNVQTSSPEIVEMVGHAGFDYAMLDWEHGSYGFDTLVELIRAAQAVDLTPIVRIPDNTPSTVCRVLDAGALGIVAPQVETAQEAIAVARAARYLETDHPFGQRGACPSTRATGHLATNWVEFSRTSNREVFVAIGFESEASIDNFHAIASAPGIDAVFIGAFDLAQAMRCPGQMQHPRVMEKLQGLLAGARELQLPVFATLTSASSHEAQADSQKWIGLGARVINTVSDRRLVSLGLRERIAALRVS